MPRNQKLGPNKHMSSVKTPLQLGRRAAEREDNDEVLGVKPLSTGLTTKASIYRKFEEEIDVKGVDRVAAVHPATS